MCAADHLDYASLFVTPLSTVAGPPANRGPLSSTGDMPGRSAPVLPENVTWITLLSRSSCGRMLPGFRGRTVPTGPPTFPPGKGVNEEMGSLFVRRTLLGNLALLVLVAFVATFATGAALPRYSEAAPTEDRNLQFQVDFTRPLAVQGRDLQWVSTPGQTAKRTLTDSTTVTIPIQVLTHTSFDTVLAALKILKDAGTVVDGLDGSKVSSAVYKVYNVVYGVVYYVYQFVYTWVYSAGLATGTNRDYELAFYSNGTKLSSIYLDLEPPPPRPTGGGAGAAAPAPPAVTPVDAGKVESTATTSTLTADATRVEQQAATQPKVELVVPQDLVRATNYVSVSADALAKAFDLGKPVVVGAGDLRLEIPPQAMDYKPLVGQGLTVRAEFSRAAVGVLPANYRAAGDAWDVTIRVLKGTEDKGGISSFLAKVTLALPYKADGLDENKLGLYRSTDGSWAYRVSKVDKARKQVMGWLTSLSRYAALAYEKTFADIATHWARNDIEVMAARHVVQGMPDGTFAPDAGVTRAQFAAFVTRCLGLEPGGAAGFSDVPANVWYAGVVAAAAKAGIVKGFEDGTFRPDEPITREQVAAMVTRALKVAGKEVALTPAERERLLAVFADRGAIGGWALDAVAVAVKEGIVRGRTVDTFAPQGTATRAEAVTMLKRLVTSVGWLS